jgi:hypothetical protein
MEMREEKYQLQEIQMGQLEFEKYIWGSELGLIIIDNLGNTNFKTSDEITEELNLDDIEDIYYIETENNVKILLKNGCTNLMVRV